MPRRRRLVAPLPGAERRRDVVAVRARPLLEGPDLGEHELAGGAGTAGAGRDGGGGGARATDARPRPGGRLRRVLQPAHRGGPRRPRVLVDRRAHPRAARTDAIRTGSCGALSRRTRQPAGKRIADSRNAVAGLPRACSRTVIPPSRECRSVDAIVPDRKVVHNCGGFGGCAPLTLAATKSAG